MIDVAARVAHVRERITGAGGRDVTIVAVTKGFDEHAIVAATAAGLHDIGENYAQELLAKFAAVELVGEGAAAAGTPKPNVHFIGRLQTNKVRALVGVVDLWQTVDRVALGRELARRSPGARVLAQVNVSDEPTKSGCAPCDAPSLVSELRELGLVVEGLMTVGRTGEPASAREGFRLLRSLADDLGLRTRSMGMTDDLEVAVEEGSTMVRVGSALFGPRPIPRARAN